MKWIKRIGLAAGIIILVGVPLHYFVFPHLGEYSMDYRYERGSGASGQSSFGTLALLWMVTVVILSRRLQTYWRERPQPVAVSDSRFRRFDAPLPGCFWRLLSLTAFSAIAAAILVALAFSYLSGGGTPNPPLAQAMGKYERFMPGPPNPALFIANFYSYREIYQQRCLDVEIDRSQREHLSQAQFDANVKTNCSDFPVSAAGMECKYDFFTVNGSTHWSKIFSEIMQTVRE